MGYDQVLADRVRNEIQDLEGFTAKEMFGGVGFMLHGNMCCGVINDGLIVRVGPEAYEQALEGRLVSEFDMTGRPMRGWVVVNQRGVEAPGALESWVMQGVRFAQSLPKK